MKAKQNRPVNLDLTTFKFPVTSIASILHRASGFFLFLVIPVLLCALGSSLSSEAGYASVMQWGESFFCRLIIGVIVAALFYHLVAGVRHMVMDLGYGETLEEGQMIARLTLGVGIIGGGLLFLMVLF